MIVILHILFCKTWKLGNTFKSRKNVFYFDSKTLFVLEKIKL